MTADHDAQRSADACPVCGQHRLTLIGFPDMSARGVMPYDELIGMGDPTPDTPPAIGCLACGSDWPDLDSFRTAQRETRGEKDLPS